MFCQERSNEEPIVCSTVVLWTPSVSRSQFGVEAVTAPLMTAKMPKTPMEAQSTPDAPRLPRISDSAVEEPINVVTAAISMTPVASVGRTLLKSAPEAME